MGTKAGEQCKLILCGMKDGGCCVWGDSRVHIPRCVTSQCFQSLVCFACVEDSLKLVVLLRCLPPFFFLIQFLWPASLLAPPGSQITSVRCHTRPLTWVLGSKQVLRHSRLPSPCLALKENCLLWNWLVHLQELSKQMRGVLWLSWSPSLGLTCH